MALAYHFTRISTNAKTGPIPATTSSRATCPTSCPLKKQGCYADYGPMSIHWNAVSAGVRGGTLDDLCKNIRGLPRGQLWRYGQAGDLPGDTVLLDAAGVESLVVANMGRRGFAFTHYDPTIKHNAAVVRAANDSGFRVNVSANNLEHADVLAELDVGPVATLLPKGATKPVRTPGGRFVAVCPATVRDDTDCASCGICAKERKAIIGFPAHGTGANRAQAVFWAKAAAC